jgi:hypothetical protein
VLDLNLNLRSTLRFSEGFPARTSAWSSRPVTGVLANDDLGLVSLIPFSTVLVVPADMRNLTLTQILAWKENLVVVWKPRHSSKTEDLPIWRVSTVLSTAHDIHCLDQEQGPSAVLFVRSAFKSCPYTLLPTDIVALTSAAGIEVWKTDLKAAVNVWDRVWVS